MSAVFGGDPVASRHTDPATSHAAGHNKQFRMRWGSHRHLLLLAFHGAELTDPEAALLADISHWAATKRCSELRTWKMIEPTGDTRPTPSGSPAMVCRITAAGRHELKVTHP